jgi:hypothetical protein
MGALTIQDIWLTPKCGTHGEKEGGMSSILINIPNNFQEPMVNVGTTHNPDVQCLIVHPSMYQQNE